MLKILQALSKEYDPKIGYKKSNISINKFPINLNYIKQSEPQNLLYGHSRVFDPTLFQECIYTYFKNIYSKIKIIDKPTPTPQIEDECDLIIDIYGVINNYSPKNYVTLFDPIRKYMGVDAELLFFPFGKLMGYPIIHIKNASANKQLEFPNVDAQSDTYNLLYRESEQENEHCFDCFYAKKLGLKNIKHTDQTLDNYITSLIIYPLTLSDKTINDIDFDLTEYFDDPSQFTETTQFTKEAPFVPITTLPDYKTAKYKLPYVFTIVDLENEMKIMHKFFPSSEYYVSDLSHTKDPIQSIITSNKPKYCIKLRPSDDFKFSSKAKIFLAPYSCNIDCHDINLTGDTADLNTLDTTVRLQDIVNFKMYYNFVERNLRHWFLSDDTQTCCYDCVFAQSVDKSLVSKKKSIYHDIMKNYLPIQRLKVLLMMSNEISQ